MKTKSLLIIGFVALIPSLCIAQGLIKRQTTDNQDNNTRVQQNVFRDNDLDISMILVKNGTFIMGSNEKDKYSYPNNRPAHKVTLTKDFYIGETEVTQKLWKKVMGKNPSHFKGDNRPVANVTYDEVLQFLKLLNAKYNKDKAKPYRLPTEAEWEYAARGGHKMTNTLFAGSNDVTEVASTENLVTYKTDPPKSHKPNELGIYDMSGNVAELTSDWYTAYSSKSQIDPQFNDKSVSIGDGHVYRGGSTARNAFECTVYYRMDFSRSREYYIGFRLCKDY